MNFMIGELRAFTEKIYIPPTANRPMLFLRFLLWIMATVLLIWAFTSPNYRGIEGYLSGEFVVPFAISVALLILGWGFSGKFRRFSFWFSIALIGQANTLQLIDAGNLIHYQHYKQLSQLFTEQSGTLLWIMIHSLIVAISLKKNMQPLRALISYIASKRRFILLVLFFVLSSAALSEDPNRYLGEIIFAAYLLGLNLTTLVLMLASFPAENLIKLKQCQDRLFGTRGDEASSRVLKIDRFAILASLFVIFVTASLSRIVYENHPHVPDEVAYLIQARLFAEGSISVPAPVISEAFDVYLMDANEDQWFPVTSPGWPAILSLGVRMNAPWIVNPLLAGINLLLVYLLLANLYSLRLARISIFLLALSPWYIFMGMNFMTHTLTLTCALFSSLGLLWTYLKNNPRYSLLAGISLGLLSLTRMLDALIMSLLLLIFAFGISKIRLRSFALLGLGVGAVLIGWLNLSYNFSLTGDPAVFPMNAYLDQKFWPNVNAYGFGSERGMGWPHDPNPGHSVVDGLINASLNTFSLNVELFGWATGSLLLVAYALLAGLYEKPDKMMMAACFSVFAFYYFYYFSGGPDFGARYWYLMIVPLTALTVRGYALLGERLKQRIGGDPFSSTRVLLGVGILSIMALLIYIPWRATDKYFHYLDMRPDIRIIEREYDFANGLILVNGDLHPDYASAAIYNPLDIYSDETIYVWNRNPEVRSQVLEFYRNRPIWIIHGPSVTGLGFEISRGPLSATELLDEPEMTQ